MATRHPHSKTGLNIPAVKMCVFQYLGNFRNLIWFSLCPLASVLSAGTTENNQTASFSFPPIKYLHTLIRSLLSLPFFSPNNSSTLSVKEPTRKGVLLGYINTATKKGKTDWECGSHGRPWLQWSCDGGFRIPRKGSRTKKNQTTSLHFSIADFNLIRNLLGRKNSMGSQKSWLVLKIVSKLKKSLSGGEG